MALIITLISIVLIGTTIRIFIWKRKKSHLISIDNDVEQFRTATNSNSIDDIVKYGDKLIWNEHLTPNLLKEISAVVEKQSIEDSKLEELKLNIYNRQLRFDRINPDTWWSS